MHMFAINLSDDAQVSEQSPWKPRLNIILFNFVIILILLTH